jgi:hypothetical protein
VAKAAVTLTGTAAKTTTDGNGEYDFLNVKVGHYTLTMAQADFAKSTTDVAVDVEARQRVDIALQVGVVSDSVTANGPAAVSWHHHLELHQREALLELLQCRFDGACALHP